jgi:hypothetical protein
MSGELLAAQDRLTVCTGAATPVPVTTAADGEFAASLTKETVEEATPLACGVKVTVKFAVWPEFSVSGNVNPLMENSLLPALPPVTVTVPPLATSDAFCVPLVPTTTLPTLIVPGLTLNCPCADPVAEPLNVTVRLESAAFEVIATDPLALPEDFGLYVTLKDVLWLGPNVIGVVTPEMENPVPEIDT